MKLHARYIAVLISCIVLFVGSNNVYAQTLPLQEIVAEMQRGLQLRNAKKYSEALEIFLRVGKNTQLQKSVQEKEIFQTCQLYACSCYRELGKYEKGYDLAKRTLLLQLNENDKRRVSFEYVYCGYRMANALTKKADAGLVEYKTVRELLYELEPFADEQLKSYIASAIPRTWYKEGHRHFIQYNFGKSLFCFEQAYVGYKYLGKVNDQITSLVHQAECIYNIGNFNEAINRYEKAFILAKNAGNDSHLMDIANRLNTLYNKAGNQKAGMMYANVTDSLMQNSSDNKVRYSYYIQQGKQARAQGRYDIAEQWLVKSLGITEYQYDSYVGLRDLYIDMEEYDKALEYAQMALEDYKRVFGPDDISYYLCYYSFARIYSCMGDKDNCKSSLDSLFKIEPYLSNAETAGMIYSLRAGCESDFKEYEKALEDYLEADKILSVKFAPWQGSRTSIIASIGGVLGKLGKYEESVSYYKQYLEAVKHKYGENSLDFVKAQIFLSNAQGFLGNLKDGCNNYVAAQHKMKDVIRNRIPYMNSAEREGFWAPISELLNHMTAYALKAGEYNTEYTSACYNGLLMSKAFLLDSERYLFDIIEKEGSDADKKDYRQMQMLGNKIKIWEKDYTANADSILKASGEKGNIERSLMDRIKEKGNIVSFIDVDYEKVKGSLGRNEKLIDFTDFVHSEDGRRYAAYVVDVHRENPLLMPLFVQWQFDSLNLSRPDMYYRMQNSKEILKLVWDPIAEYISKGDTVYYIPSHTLFSISLESLPLEDGTLLGDHYKFIRLSSARELVHIKGDNTDVQAATAVLYGGLQYHLDSSLMVQNTKRYNVSQHLRTRGEGKVRGNSPYDEIPGTKDEVDEISGILKGAGYDVQIYSDDLGTEESFLALDGKAPAILHLATHGFYYTPDEAVRINYLKGYSDAMMLSGIILSGGNAAWMGKSLPEGVLGGVLSAESIASMNLKGNDMVVLSCCKSGRGEATPEGLYGLQRSFKKAGAGTLVMTLWNVGDDAAKDFMTVFYKELIYGKYSKREAFSRARRQMRETYKDNPYYWAAFVMLD